MEGIYQENLPQSLQTALITHLLLHMTVPTYVEYKAVFDVGLVNIHLPFQHKTSGPNSGSLSHFCFYMGKALLGTQRCVPKLS